MNRILVIGGTGTVGRQVVSRLVATSGQVRALVSNPSLSIDDHGSFVIYRSASVRPRHLFDQNLDHDYFFKLPVQGVGCPITYAVFYFSPCLVPSFPTYEPNSNDGEYSQPFRHIQYKRIPAGVPWPPWQCSCAGASPGACTAFSNAGCSVLLLALLRTTGNATKNSLTY